MKFEKENTVEIYGHSLAPADGDILQIIFELPNTHVHIFYLNENDRYNKLKNITSILGANKTIELVGGLDPQITFDLI